MGKYKPVGGIEALDQVRVALVQGDEIVHASAVDFPWPFQPLDATLTTIAALTGAADKGIVFTGADVASLFDLSSFARTYLDDTTADATRTTLEIVAGTYTPTLTNNANVAASTAFLMPYLRVGPFVAVGVYCSIDPTLAAPTATSLGISLPVASNFANVHECMGAATNGRTGGSGDTIWADVANDRATLNFAATSTAADIHTGSFFYRII